MSQKGPTFYMSEANSYSLNFFSPLFPMGVNSINYSPTFPNNIPYLLLFNHPQIIITSYRHANLMQFLNN